jgi:hypothetical protein
VQGQLALLLAAAGVADLEEVNKVIILLSCVLLQLVRCTLALCSFALSVFSLLLTCDDPPALCGFQEVSMREWQREAGWQGCGGGLWGFGRE